MFALKDIVINVLIPFLEKDFVHARKIKFSQFKNINVQQVNL